MKNIIGTGSGSQIQLGLELDDPQQPNLPFYPVGDPTRIGAPGAFKQPAQESYGFFDGEHLNHPADLFHHEG